MAKINYKQNPQKDDGVRYVREDGEVRKKYVAHEWGDYVFLRDTQTIDPNNTPIPYPSWAVFKNQDEA